MVDMVEHMGRALMRMNFYYLYKQKQEDNWKHKRAHNSNNNHKIVDNIFLITSRLETKTTRVC